MGIGDNVGESVGENTGTSGKSYIGTIPDTPVTGIFVDQTLSANITDGSYNPLTRSSDPGNGSGDAYPVLQDALDAMVASDVCYLRGGTYTTTGGGNSGQSGAVWTLKFNIDGTAQNPTTITSYPGEWAILDGQNATPYGVVLGYRSTDSSQTHADDYSNWLIERLEITGGTGTNSGYAGGIWMNGGPFTIRYCYFHDNTNASESENPNALTGKAWQNVTVEYNWFYNNGSTAAGNNGTHIAVYTDYYWDDHTLQDINNAMHSNVIRYNIMDSGSYGGYKHKGSQNLASTGTDLTYKEYGDKVHHNIFLNMEEGVMTGQDFCQIYQNITDGCAIYDNENCSTCDERYNTTIYNNTVLASHINHTVQYSPAATNVAPYMYIVNNIVDSYSSDWDKEEITVARRMSSSGTFTGTNLTIDSNLIYKPLDADHIIAGNTGASGDPAGYFTVSEFNTAYSVSNYNTSTNGLYVGATGADQYITVGTFVVDTGVTIADGIGGAHPFLTGVTFPTFIGATNPNDNGWVDGLFTTLRSTTWLKNQTSGSVPTWVEGT